MAALVTGLGDNPDRSRHVLTSFRELWNQDSSANWRRRKRWQNGLRGIAFKDICMTASLLDTPNSGTC